MQNSAIGAIAIHSFVLGYHNVAKNKENRTDYPKLDFLFFVLPIVYNQDSRETFLSSTQLYSALKNNKTIVVGLQERATKMSGQTFNALNLTFNKEILTYNKTEKLIELCDSFKKKKLPIPLAFNTELNTVKKILDSAYKLGSIFAKKDETDLQIELNIRF